MLTLPKRIIQVLRCFEEAIRLRVWEWAKVLLIGAILAPGDRPVTAILRVMGLHQERQFQNEHRVLNRATWGRQMMRQLRRWLPGRRLVVVADSSYSVLELLACAARMIEPVAIVTRLRLDAALYDPAPVRKPRTTGRPRKKGARQPTLAKRLTDPGTDGPRSSVAWYGGTTRTVELASATAVWYHNGLPPVAIRWVLIRDPQGQFDPQALLCTDQQAQAQAILAWFALRWPMEVTFHELRAHLGVETQRQWSDLAILRTTPALLALFSLVTVFAHQLLQGQPLPVRQAAW
jgi:hypothetical protein